MTQRSVQWWRYPGYAFGVLSNDKSFRKNPLIGHPYLNELGLHRERVRLAAGIARNRRKFLGRSLDQAEREQFERDGFVIRENALASDVFGRIREFLKNEPLPAREMRQGQTVTRMIPIGPQALQRLPDLAEFSDNRSIADLVRYVGGCGGDPIYYIQTVIAEPARKEADPQTALHADTFHSTSKAWLFLDDVGPDDGPFVFVPGSHKLTRERIEWEYRQSLIASNDARAHHADGSFRITPEELSKLGDYSPRKVTVPANTLVVADTYAFHSRAVSFRPTVRVELHAYHRGNPFNPLPLSGMSMIPGIKDRRLDIFLAMSDRKAKRDGRVPTWRDVGECTAYSEPHI
ncbi:phytanoyl-CoA dioxygenase family protein [Rhizobium sp. NTR19]|uniref:Phytanoyl-CoA dioxygenase family protein n=1 Tax=Neorhizobium turbinariae TaxID=2937795 RepID=A0ABT0ITJ8_9HYPH|nr:phytanoyl-CoA dioxygenase family protein [Neorhizobium turbinariae]MCK8781193.1 phytanoyl-CoA dioxygenase family protein [Neorhizobium turbinariae]